MKSKPIEPGNPQLLDNQTIGGGVKLITGDRVSGYAAAAILSPKRCIMPISGYFDFKRDTKIVNAGGFFCQACLVGKPLDDISPDSRYCRGCYEFLNKEASILPAGKHPRWVPKTPQPKIRGEKPIPVPQDAVLIMATVKGKKSEVAIIQPPVAKVTHEKRGPKHKDLPVELITQWVGEGMGYKRIAAKLKAEHDINVGFRTIARAVKGERLLI